MPNTPFFYCPAHQLRIRANGESAVLCEQGGHELGRGFPDQSWWKYCCDCATFWPSEVAGGSLSSSDCLVCERQSAKRFVCAACQVISIESATSVRRKSHFIEVATGINPSCPGCKTVATSPVLEHECSEIGLRYLTARDTCLFCEEQITTPDLKAVTAACWSCGTNLMAPFRFCKHCGSAQDQIPIEPADVHPIPTTTAGETIFHDDSRSVDEGITEHDTESETTSIDAEAVSSYSNSWQQTNALPPKRRTPWKMAVASLFVAIAILITVVWLYSKPKANQPDSETIPSTPVPPAGMVFIAGGEFLMGDDQGDEYERPAHRVFVQPFFMDITEVTCEKYLAFIKDTGHRAPPQWTNDSYSDGAGDLPVTGVDWYDANAYAQWAKKRLPSEQEWEFAARANDGRKYPWGNTWRADAANAGESSPQRLMSVGTHLEGKTPSGLMDMIGNAWEWTASDMVAYPNRKLTKRHIGDLKVIRGGSWQELPDQATTTYRGYLRKTGADDYSATGFRCAKDVKSDNLNVK